MIFRKNKPESMQPQAQGQQQPAAPEQATPDITEQQAAPVEQLAGMAHGNVSVLTSDVVMEGNLLTSGELHLDGTIHGAVQASRVIIDVNGAVNGQVVAQEIIVRGRAIGPICGVRIELAPGAQVQGDVISQSIVVQDGAFIDGQIRHSEDPLGEWQQMWHEAEAEAEAEQAAPVEEDMAAGKVAEEVAPHGGEEEHPTVDMEEPAAPYLRPAAEEEASEAVEEDMTTESGGDKDGEKDDQPKADA